MNVVEIVSPQPMPVKVRSKNFNQTDQTALCHAWLDVSEDPLVGADQSSAEFWAKIALTFNQSMLYDGTPYRCPNRLVSKCIGEMFCRSLCTNSVALTQKQIMWINQNIQTKTILISASKYILIPCENHSHSNFFTAGRFCDTTEMDRPHCRSAYTCQIDLFRKTMSTCL